MTVPSEPARDRPHAGCQRVVVGEANVQPLPCPIGMPPAASHTRPLAPPPASLGWRHHGHCHAPAEHVLGVPVGGASSDEIARASCRERVCQKEYISEVPVS